MEVNAAIGLTAVVFLGVSAHWLAWRSKVPAILLLLITGFIAGPVTGFLDPDALFGDLLFPLVSLAVGLILFEGGLSLRLAELRTIGRALRSLVLVGAAVSWILTTVAAWLFLDLAFPLALLLGAILVVTGPTVIIPLLRQIKPKEPVNSLLKWEGILIDPLGATLALLVFEGIRHTGTGTAAATVVLAIVRTLLLGGSLGLAGGVVLSRLLQRYWIPDYLQNPVSMMFVLCVFTLSNAAQHESGLLAVTVMGVYLANQTRAEVRHIVEFKENLRVLLIAGLFIVLSARLQLHELSALPLASIAFFAAIVLVARPASVFISTAGTSLARNEKFFLSWVAPRGIVAASVSSVFALRLTEAGHNDAGLIASATFLVIIGTVVLYGLTAGPVARRLEIAQPNPRGLLFLGAHPWARALAKALQEAGIPVLVCDTNRGNITKARMDGLRTYHGDVLSEHGTESANLSGIGGFLALTPNNDTNALACKHFEPIFGRVRVFQLSAADPGGKGRQERPRHLRGRDLFGTKSTYAEISKRFDNGAEFKSTPLTDEFTFDSFKAHYGERALPLMVIGKDGFPEPLTDDDGILPQPGQTLLSLADPKSAEQHSNE